MRLRQCSAKRRRSVNERGSRYEDVVWTTVQDEWGKNGDRSEDGLLLLSFQNALKHKNQPTGLEIVRNETQALGSVNYRIFLEFPKGKKIPCAQMVRTRVMKV